MKVKVFVQDHEVYFNGKFPDADMAKNKNLTEFYICNIKGNDFDMNRLDQYGDGVVRIKISGNNSSWKKGWTIERSKRRFSG